MIHSNSLALVSLMFVSGYAAEIVIEDFRQSTHSWRAKNDPVMGGKSHGSVSIEDGVGIVDGEVVNVPFLQAPGFITMETNGGVYPDVSSCVGLKLTLRSRQDYSGYRFNFGNVHVPGGRFAFGYKTNFNPPVGNDFGEVEIPFTDFSARWDDATGDQIVSCKDDKEYCPTVGALQNLKTMSIWGEGVAGKVHLEILVIKAVGCEEPTQGTATDALDVSVVNDEIDIESFNNIQHQWSCLNDPVMGGESSASGGAFPDVSSCTALKLVLMAREEYHGYRVSFGTLRLPNAHHASGFKANFEAPLGAFDEVVVPFKDFSSHWDDATGDQIVSCTEDSTYCPDVETLSNMKTISIWGEGVAGNVTLIIKSISAVGCGSTAKTDFVPQLSTSRSEGAVSLPFARALFGGVMVAILVAVVLLGVSKRRKSTYDPVREIDV
ncbi:hypothetical protein MHU86_2585 [Fragilaria crotonensis]|nr:hypothetical protein MHU86_2585 [Fragilaria crotonensis]